MANVSKYAGIFLIVLTLVLGFTAVAPVVFGGGAPPGVQPENASTFDPSAIVAADYNETGNVSVGADPAGKVILIDAAHANSFTRSEIQPLVQSLVEEGHEVRYYGTSGQSRGGFSGSSERSLNASLRNADALVTISPGRRYTDAEIRGVRNFTERGGRVVMLAEPESVSISLGGGGGPFGVSVQQVRSQLTPLSSVYGIGVGTEYLFNMEDNAKNFQYVYATPAADGPLTEGVDRVVLPKATQVTVDDRTATIAMTTIQGTRLVSTRKAGTFAVAARNGNVSVIGDSSFVTPDFYRVADNDVLLGNVVAFLTTGEKVPKPTTSTGLGGPEGPGQPPRPPRPGGPTPPPVTPAG